MRLATLAITSIVASSICLVALLGFGLYQFQKLSGDQREVGALAALDRDLDALLSTSDALLLRGGDAGDWRGFRRQARSIQNRLEALAADSDSARRAIAESERLVTLVGGDTGSAKPASDGIPAMDIRPSASARLLRIADAGMALDGALGDALEARRSRVAKRGVWLGGIAAAAAGVFGLLFVGVFSLLRRRVSEPLRGMISAIDRLEAGEESARAPVAGSAELAEVARAFNRLVDAQDAARRGLDQYRVLVESTSEGCAVLDGDGRFRLANRAYAEHLGVAPETIQGQLITDVLGEDAFAHVAAGHGACMAGDYPIFELALDSPPLGPRELLVKFHPIEVGPEHERRAGVITTDVTALERSRADYEALFQAIPDAVLLLRGGRYIVDASAPVAESFGWSREWLIGREITDVSPSKQPDGRGSAEKAAAVIDAAIRGGTQRIEWEAVRGDGHRVLVEVVVGALHGSYQADAFAIGRDITAERELRADHEHKRRLIEASEDRICIVDNTYCYVFATESYAALYDLDPAALEGRPKRDILGLDSFEREAKPAIDRALAGDYPAFETERHHRRLGWRHFLVRYYPLPSSDGTVRQVGNVMTDVTALKQAETQLRKQQRLIELAGRSARLGGWSIDLATGEIEWSDIVAEIHGLPVTYSPTLDDALSFYTPASRERLEALFTACAERGEPYDEELQIIAADGAPVSVRATGEPVRDKSGRIVRVEGACQDVSERRKREWQLRQMVHIVEQSPASIVVTDTEGHIEYVNASAESVSGYTSDELIGATNAVFQAGETPPETYRELWGTIQAGRIWQGEIRNRRKNGELYWEYEYISPLTDDTGQIVNYIAVKEDISEYKRVQDELRAAWNALNSAVQTQQALINSLPAHIALLDSQGQVIDINKRWREFGQENESSDPSVGVGINYIALCEQATGECAEDAHNVATELRAVLFGGKRSLALEYPCHGPNEFRWFRVEARRLESETDSGEGGGAVVMHVDISDRKRAEQELDRLAHEDPLTHLPSRHGFVRNVSQHVATIGWQPHAAIVLLDLDRQRDINDTYGYDGGDALLVQVGQRLGAHAGEDAHVARIGGDEFAVFLPARSDTEGEARREALAEAFASPLRLEETTIDPAAHFGYSLLGDTGGSIEELIREAELALFHSRDDAADQGWKRYTPQLDAETQQRITLTRELREALERHEFELHFQPKVDLRQGRLIAAEALIRWLHPERGLQSPATFVPVAEQSQLIGPIGDWAVREACRRAAESRAAGLDLVPVAVNVSVAQFTSGGFAATVRDALEAFDVPAWALSLEITESVFEQESERLQQQLKMLSEMGVRLSLDDFGTGYSSLSYLQHYAFDEIKIDKGFVQSMLDDNYSRKIVQTVMALAQAIGAEVVAEGVENMEVRDALLAEGAWLGQGFYYSMPLAPEDFQWLLDQGSTLPLRGVHPLQGSAG